jgi:hypothetical protein
LLFINLGVNSIPLEDSFQLPVINITSMAVLLTSEVAMKLATLVIVFGCLANFSGGTETNDICNGFLKLFQKFF